MDNQVFTGSQAQVKETSFLSSVYLWMSVGLGLSAFSSFYLLTQPTILKAIFGNSILLIAIVVAQLALVFGLSAAIMRIGAGLATALFLAYSALNGVTLTSIFFVYTGDSIIRAFAISGGTFLFFSIYGVTTKRDLTSMGGFLTMGLIGLILAFVVNMFLKSTQLDWILSFVGVAIFMGLTAYDTQALKAMNQIGFENDSIRKRMAIIGALKLYLDFINLFLMMLRIFGGRRN